MRKLRKSKSFKLSLILILVVSMALPVVASAGSRGSQLYSDVNPGHWFYNDVEILSKKGAINGYPDDKFRPFNKITHAETIKVISTMYDSDVEKRDMEIRINSLNTTKNKPNHWATKYLQAAYNNKIFTLNEMGLAYDEPATRHDTALYMLNYINAKTKEDKVEPLIFNDGPLSDSYFLDAHGPGLNFLFEAGIVLGTPDEENGVSFNGREPITRAEFTAMMNRTILFVEPSNSSSKWGVPSGIPSGAILTETVVEEKYHAFDYIVNLPNGGYINSITVSNSPYTGIAATAMGYDENNQFFRGGITPSRKDNIYYEYSLPDLTIEARTKILEVLNTFFDAYGY